MRSINKTGLNVTRTKLQAVVVTTRVIVLPKLYQWTFLCSQSTCRSEKWEVGGGERLGEEGRAQCGREVTLNENSLLGISSVFFRKKTHQNKTKQNNTDPCLPPRPPTKKTHTKTKKSPETQHHFSVSLGWVPFVLLPISCILTLGEPEALCMKCTACEVLWRKPLALGWAGCRAGTVSGNSKWV